jgi:hypothetical protein
MATEVTDLEIQIPADEMAPAAADVVIAEPVVKSKPTPKILEPEEGLEKLKKQLADEQRDKVAATERARAAEADAAAARASETTARTEAADSRLHLVTTAIASVTQSLDVGERDYAQALADGDHARAAKINREMGRSQAKLEQLETAKQNIEQAPKVMLRPASAPDVVEQLAGRLSPRSAAWVREHPDYARDPRLNRKMIRAHEDAMDDGISPDTDAYFEAIETKLNLRTPAVADADIDTAPQRATGGRASAPAAAPVSRSGSGNGSARPRTMTLTKDMVEMAHSMGMTDQEYAKYRQELIDEGQIH